MISSILPALLLIGAVVFIHELGHYLAARSIGVKVEKFSVCFGPRIFAFTSVKEGGVSNLFCLFFHSCAADQPYGLGLRWLGHLLKNKKRA